MASSAHMLEAARASLHTTHRHQHLRRAHTHAATLQGSCRGRCCAISRCCWPTRAQQWGGARRKHPFDTQPALRAETPTGSARHAPTRHGMRVLQPPPSARHTPTTHTHATHARWHARVLCSDTPSDRPRGRHPMLHTPALACMHCGWQGAGCIDDYALKSVRVSTQPQTTNTLQNCRSGHGPTPLVITPLQPPPPPAHVRVAHPTHAAASAARQATQHLRSSSWPLAEPHVQVPGCRAHAPKGPQGRTFAPVRPRRLANPASIASDAHTRASRPQSKQYLTSRQHKGHATHTRLLCWHTDGG
jgi:hypothetical protein